MNHPYKKNQRWFVNSSQIVKHFLVCFFKEQVSIVLYRFEKIDRYSETEKDLPLTHKEVNQNKREEINKDKLYIRFHERQNVIGGQIVYTVCTPLYQWKRYTAYQITSVNTEKRRRTCTLLLMNCDEWFKLFFFYIYKQISGTKVYIQYATNNFHFNLKKNRIF